MLTGIICFVGGIAFHKFYPTPGNLVLDKVTELAKKARDAITKATPPAQ